MPSQILGTVAAVAGLVLIILSIPKQIIRNHKRKSVEGLEPYFVYSLLISYGTWTAYGFVKPDWFIFSSQFPGLILSLVLLGQIFLYGTPRNR